jgi:phosphoribosylamine--glycine ligase
MVDRAPTIETSAGFCVGILMTTPPFPYSREEIDEPVGLPVILGEGIEADNLHFGEVGLDAAGQLATSGLYGWTLVVTGCADSIAAARRRAAQQAASITIANVRYRLDIGERLIQGDWARLESLGLLDATPKLSTPAPEHLR